MTTDMAIHLFTNGPDVLQVIAVAGGGQREALLEATQALRQALTISGTAPAQTALPLESIQASPAPEPADTAAPSEPPASSGTEEPARSRGALHLVPADAALAACTETEGRARIGLADTSEEGTIRAIAEALADELRDVLASARR